MLYVLQLKRKPRECQTEDLYHDLLLHQRRPFGGCFTTVTAMSHKPSQSTTAVVAGILGVAFLLAGLALTRKPRY